METCGCSYFAGQPESPGAAMGLDSGLIDVAQLTPEQLQNEAKKLGFVMPPPGAGGVFLDLMRFLEQLFGRSAQRLETFQNHLLVFVVCRFCRHL